MVYLIVTGEYSDWSILGYFTDRRLADRYCALHSDYDCYVKPAKDLTDIEDLSEVVINYEHEVVIDRTTSGWVVRKEPYRYTTYCSEHLKSNHIWSASPSRWVGYRINIAEDNREKAEKIALDYHYQLLALSDNKVTNDTIDHMNDCFRKPEIDRIKSLKEKKIQETELKELARLKAKYES